MENNIAQQSQSENINPYPPAPQDPTPAQPLPRHMSKTIAIVGIVVLLIILFAGTILGVYNLGKKSATPNPTPVAKATPTPTMIKSEAETTKYYSIPLPEDWYNGDTKGTFTQYSNYDISKAEGRDFSPILDKGKLKVEVYQTEGTQLPEMNDEDQDDESGPNKLISSKQISLDGQPAIEKFYTNYFLVITKVPNKDILIYITFFLDFNNYKSTADQILSTFKFTDTTSLNLKTFNVTKLDNSLFDNFTFSYPHDWTASTTGNSKTGFSILISKKGYVLKISQIAAGGGR